MYFTIFFMSISPSTFYNTTKYQQIAKILQYHVFINIDSKKFADMSWVYDLDYTYSKLLQLTGDSDNLFTIEEKLREFVSDFFIEDNEGRNIPEIKHVEHMEFVDKLEPHLKEVYLLIHNKWYTYARKDKSIYTKDDKNFKTGTNLKNFNEDGSDKNNIMDDMDLKNIENNNNNKSINLNDINLLNTEADSNKNSNLNVMNLKNSEQVTNKNSNMNDMSLNNEENNKDKTSEDSLTTNSFIGSNKIPLPYLYFVPGGRFKEAYYWDSYWILLGLLSSNMKMYAFDLVRSMSYLINKYGYIPNGTRKYYLGRSQPPFFAEMLKKLYDANIERDWILNEGLQSLEKEYEWWMTNRHFDEGTRLNRYKITKFSGPRPEAFKEDLPFKDKYKEIWGATESGWDFSYRWFKDGKSISEMCTGDIIPVDLNVYLLTAEQIIISFNIEKLKLIKSNKKKRNTVRKNKLNDDISGKDGFNKLNDDISGKDNFSDSEDAEIVLDDFSKDNKQNKYKDDSVKSKEDNIYKDNIKTLQDKIDLFTKYKNQRISDINKFLWNEDLNVWLDYNTESKKHNTSYFFSNITPLFANIPIKNGNIYNILDLYKKELFGYPGGIPASNVDLSSEASGQQWDFPNVWAPLVQMFTEYMIDVDYPLALHVAKSFFRSVYEGMGVNRSFHEKYNCLLVGESGKGGEYEPQEGFGWTNGTISWMIETFGNKLTLEDDHAESYEKICEVINDKKIK
ncbi:trehalase [Vairimorpha necatrix]|uniref:Trehalase n=1 Tax=Vairimorpha necatrix TaxID=6039 RepID=A0AAX4JF07_9MICR